jgi:hypothetical protein
MRPPENDQVSRSDAKRNYRRGGNDPLPTVYQIEDALDTLLTAIIKHERKRTSNPAPITLRWLDFSTEWLPGEMFLMDPIGRSLREGVKQLGKTLFALTGSTDAMRESCERVCDRDSAHWGRRADIIDKRWDGIGEGSDRWWS